MDSDKVALVRCEIVDESGVGVDAEGEYRC